MKRYALALVAAVSLLTACETYCSFTAPPHTTYRYTYTHNNTTTSGLMTTNQDGAVDIVVPEDFNCGQVTVTPVSGPAMEESQV